MGTLSSHFLEKPRTKLGWWSVGLGAVFTILFLAVTNDLFPFPGILTMAVGVIAGTLTLIALIFKSEHSWMIWLMLLPGLFAILFALGEFFFPH